MPRAKPSIGLWIFLTFSLLPSVASAHLVSTRFGELYSGLLHPLTALVHVVPWLALGLLSGIQGRDSARWVLLLFPLSVCVGAIVAGWLPALEFVDYINVLSFVVLGILVALARHLGMAIFIGLTLLVGVSHGYTNGTAELAGNQQLLYVLGVTLAAYLLITLASGIAYVMVERQQWSKIAVRALGSWIAAIGIIFGGFTLFGTTA